MGPMTRATRQRTCRGIPFVLAVVAYFVAVASHCETAVIAKPTRIVSLNLCTDELVLRLAEPSRIASVTWLAREVDSSNVVDLALRVSINHGFAEEVAAAKPDLVVAGRYTARTAVALLKRSGIPVTDFDAPRSIDEVRKHIRAMAQLLGELDKGERIIERMDRRLAAMAPPPTPRPRAIVLNPNGVTVGRGTLVDEILTRAGFDNVAAGLGIDSYGLVPLETVVTSALDVLIVGESGDGPPAMATEILRHPVLRTMADRVEVVRLPMGLLACGGPTIVDTIEQLRGVAEIAARRRALP
jgi:iron complex transport system substrate-binding protein